MRHYLDRDPDILFASQRHEAAKGWVERNPSSPDIIVYEFAVDEPDLDLDSERIDMKTGDWRPA